MRNIVRLKITVAIFLPNDRTMSKAVTKMADPLSRVTDTMTHVRL